MAKAFPGSTALPETDVAVVGAGPVGLMVANLLGLAGVKVTVLERNKGLLGLPRAIAYDAETLRLFALAGLLGQLAQASCRTRLSATSMSAAKSCLR